jgi:hypothetical protein
MMMFDIDELLKGAIDMHLHAGPDALPSRVDAIEAARQALDAGMRALVLKSEWYPTAPLVWLIKKIVPGIEVFGAVSLDYPVGGLNAYAIESSLKFGLKVVWMPTSSSMNSRNKIKKLLNLDLEGEGFNILGDNGELEQEIQKILNLVKAHDLVLANGHISPSETFALFKEAQKVGIKKMVVTHPYLSEVLEETFTIEELKHLAGMGAFIEFTAVELMPETPHDLDHIVEAIKTIGTDYCILSSDMGLDIHPSPLEGLRIFISSLLRKGITQEEIERMVKINPSKLLGL